MSLLFSVLLARLELASKWGRGGGGGVLPHTPIHPCLWACICRANIESRTCSTFNLLKRTPYIENRINVFGLERLHCTYRNAATSAH